MNNTQITYFLTVAKCLNFTEAAHELYIAQSALSKQILALETELDLKLFDRTSRSVTLTAAGEVLYRELQNHDEWLARSIDMARQAKQGKTGALSIGILHGIDFYNPQITRFSSFSEAYPEIHLNIGRLSFQAVEKELYTGQVDMTIILSFLVPDDPNIACHILESEEDLIAVSKSCAIGKKEQITPEDLQQKTHIAISPDVSPQANMNSLNYLRKIGIYPSRVKLVNTIEDVMLSVESGLGYAVISRSTRIFGEDSIRIIDIYPDTLPPPITNIVAVWRRDSVNPAVKQYIDFVSLNTEQF